LGVEGWALQGKCVAVSSSQPPQNTHAGLVLCLLETVWTSNSVEKLRRREDTMGWKADVNGQRHRRLGCYWAAGAEWPQARLGTASTTSPSKPLLRRRDAPTCEALTFARRC
jgi:hypothetical protein